MSGNTLGKLFAVTSFGESHGPAIGCIIDGCPPGLLLSEHDIQIELDKRKPGKSKYTSSRSEQDNVKILSGVFDGKTTGTPIALCVENHDQRSHDYNAIKDIFRPSHGDYAYYKKYGIRDYRGGGRASARETVARVGAGAIAKKYLKDFYSVKILAYVVQIGSIIIQPKDLDFIAQNPFYIADSTKIIELQNLFNFLIMEGDSVGAKIEVMATNVPVGLGEPVFDKLDADLAHALMSINAVKAVEIGAGFECVAAYGSQFRDEITSNGFVSNNSGGILAGISTGQDIIARVAFKPTSSIIKPAKTIDIANQAQGIKITGRHDPCVGIRAVPIVEAMVAIVLLDHLLRHRGQNGNII